MEKTQKIILKRIGNIAFAFLVASLLAGGALYAYSVPAVREAITLATTVKPETFTELYFEDHINLPKKVELEKEQSFKFTIHNLEYTDMTYLYEIKASDEKETITLSTGSATLSHNEYKTINERYTLAATGGRTKIEVLLVHQNQPIHFWLEQ